jgi:photosystem II stability/assembly factor-like uncharacterized protein
MRLPISLLILVTSLFAQQPRVQISHTIEGLRGVSAVLREIAWVSGTHGTYLRTLDAGTTWTTGQVPGAEALDFRGVVAFSTAEAFLMSSGTGEQSRIYHTSDGGKHWDLQLTNANPKGFFDSIAFWDSKHGIVVGDPIPDEAGKLKFEVLLTDDGKTWKPIPGSRLPDAKEGEGAFAASNRCIAILPNARWKLDPFDSHAVSDANNDSQIDANIWFATGGSVARVFHSGDRGETWHVFDTPILQGRDSTGIFSIAFRDKMNGVIAGGDYKRPKEDGPNLAFTHDGGKTWDLSSLHPQVFFSAVAYDHKVNREAEQQQMAELKVKNQGKKIRIEPVPPQRLFVVGDDFIFDFRPPANPRRISPNKKLGIKFNAVSPFQEGGAVIVGPKGTIVSIP